VVSEPGPHNDQPTYVLLVEDDPTVADVVTKYLDREGYAVTHSRDGLEGLSLALSEKPDCVVLDLMLPSLGGLEVCRQLRLASAVPVLMLTARDTEDDRVTGLEVGADDYLAKPFSPRELVARVKALIRRDQLPPSRSDVAIPAITIGTLHIDLPRREVLRGEEAVGLTSKEFDLLTYLVSHPGEPLSRGQLLEAVWGYTFGDPSTVTVHVRRLRGKIESDPANPALIETVWGIGYRWSP
jgi:two-component system, OmpR family, response regulator ResD